MTKALRLALLLSLACAGSAHAGGPVVDPAGTANGVAATAGARAADPSGLTATTTQSDCTTSARGALQTTPPPDDPFYAPPSVVPEGAPGTIIRSRPVCIADLQAPMPYRAFLIMFLTTGTEDAQGEPSALHAVPSVATGLVVEPVTAGPTVKRPLVAWGVAQDSDSTLQAPSYTLRAGTKGDNADWQWALAQGWDIVVPDAEGPDSAYSAGPLEGHIMLDAVRAAESMSSDIGLDGRATQVGLWGYSGGAIASAWASELAPQYAPELNVVGVAEGGVPADLHGVFDAINSGILAPGLAFASAVGANAAYPNLLPMSLLNPAGQALAAHMRATGDSSYPSTYPPQNISMYTACGCNPMDDPARFPGVAELVRTIDPGQRIPGAPLFVYHDYDDELIPIAGVSRLVKTYCDGGATVDFRVNYGDEHVSNAIVGAPEALAFLSARFDGASPVNTCDLPDNGGVVPPAPVPPLPLPPPPPSPALGS